MSSTAKDGDVPEVPADSQSSSSLGGSGGGGGEQAFAMGTGTLGCEGTFLDPLWAPAPAPAS